MLFSVDSDKDFIDVEGVTIAAMLSLESPCIEGTDFFAPQRDSFSADGDAALGEETFDIAVAEIEAIVEPDSIGNDIGRESLTLLGIHDQIIAFRRDNLAILVEWLIGIVRRELLDHAIFWTITDLGNELRDYQCYYNESRTHSGGHGDTPLEKEASTVVNISHLRWEKHCRGLFQLPMAA